MTTKREFKDIFFFPTAFCYTIATGGETNRLHSCREYILFLSSFFRTFIIHDIIKWVLVDWGCNQADTVYQSTQVCLSMYMMSAWAL